MRHRLQVAEQRLLFALDHRHQPLMIGLGTNLTHRQDRALATASPSIRNPTPDSRAAQSLLHLQTDGLVQYIPADLINENKFRSDFLIHLWGHLTMSATNPSPKTDQNVQTDESVRDGSELGDRQLDDVSGGTCGSAGTTLDQGRPPPARTP